MNKKIRIAILLLAFSSVSTSVYAINQKYRDQLEHSGCTELNAGVSCDITKSQAQNATHKPTKAQKLRALINRVEGMPVDVAYSRLLAAGWKQSEDPTLFVKNGEGKSLRLTREDNRVTKVKPQADDGE